MAKIRRNFNSVKIAGEQSIYMDWKYEFRALLFA
jgi:hypothetical protein